MPDWREIIARLQAQAGQLPRLTWVVGGVILVSLGVVVWLEMAGPAYVVLDDGLAPADGGKVIAQLQKLGIPYELQAAGNLILVPAPDLAQARLELGQAQVPGSDVATAWDRLEDAPMTASDLAQSTMAVQALEISLQQSIESMNGIRNAQVFLAIPASTPFLADQPKPTASVVIQADDGAAQAQGEAIANLIAGAVPGLGPAQVTVETSAGIAVYPAGGHQNAGSEFATVNQVEAGAAARIAGLLIPLVGAGNFQTDVSADVDFTQEHIHAVAYGPSHLVEHQVSTLSEQSGSANAAFGIPGALSNEPPADTTATPGRAGRTGESSPASTSPRQTSSHLEQSFLTDQSESDITNPDWTVKSIAVSVVLDKAAMGAVTTAQVRAAIAGAFAYPQVNVSVLAAAFQKPAAPLITAPVVQAVGPLAHAVLEVMAAAALLFGIAMPVGRRLAAVNLQGLIAAAPQQRALPVVLPPRDFSDLRDQAGENIAGVARLLQNWADDSE